MMTALWSLLCGFGKIGLVSWGGGNAMLKLIEEECLNRGWMERGDYSAMVGASFLFPGLTGVKLSGMIGWHVAGAMGAIISVIALNLPSLILALGFTSLVMRWQDAAQVKKLLTAMSFAAAALLASALWSFSGGLVNENLTWRAVILTVGFFIALTVLKLSPTLGLLGFVALYFFLV